MSTIPLLLFAKAPIAGKVKTRLHSHCSPVQAAAIAEILLEQSIVKATTVWPGEVLLSVWLGSDHEFIQLMVNRYPVKLVQQSVGDLGRKMLDSLDQFGYPAAVMGCDVPQVPASTLEYAYSLLISGDSVIGPSNDGGYYLLGLQQSTPSIFSGPEWGTDTVLETTLALANKAMISLLSLEPLDDIDEWSDLLKAADHVPELAHYLQVQQLVAI